MDAVAGLWIDHRKAIVVNISDKGEHVELILSNTEKYPNHSKTLSESQNVHADDKVQRAFTHHLSIFYDQVLLSFNEAISVIIFGPGEAKGEFKKHCEHKNSFHKIVAIETTDKMSTIQITEKVRQYISNLKRKVT